MNRRRPVVSRRRAFETLRKLEEVECRESQRRLREIQERERDLLGRQDRVGVVEIAHGDRPLTTAQDLAAESQEWARIQAQLRAVRDQASRLRSEATRSAQRALMFEKLDRR